MKQYLVEGLGTFFLALAIVLTGEALPIGLMLMTMIYMGGHISGGHFNPAVTAAMAVRNGAIPGSALLYMVAQSLGALVTGAVVYLVSGNFFMLRVPAEASSLFAMIPEFLAGFVFCSAVLVLITTDRLRTAWGLAGLPIGLALTAVVSFPGILCNPAVGICSAVGALLAGDITTGTYNLVIHVAGPILGGAVAALWFKYLNAPSVVVVEETRF